MALSDTHTFQVTVKFDKPCTKKFARDELVGEIYNTFRCDYFDPKYPTEMDIQSIKPMPKPAR